MASDALALGIDPATIPTERAGFELWAPHMPALHAFFCICGQWRVAPSGHVIGIDAAAAEAALRLSGVDVTPEIWAAVGLIEAGARKALNGEAA